MEEFDIWRTAKILIDSRGNNAWPEAAGRVKLALAQERLEVAAVWTRICRGRGAAATKTATRATLELTQGERGLSELEQSAKVSKQGSGKAVVWTLMP